VPIYCGMDTQNWFQILTAVLAANALTLWFVYSIWIVSKVEKTGQKASAAPWSALLGITIPPLLMALGGYLLQPA